MALPSEAEPPLYETPEVEDLEAALRPAWVDVDLSALEHNLVRIRQRLCAGGSTASSMHRSTYTALGPSSPLVMARARLKSSAASVNWRC